MIDRLKTIKNSVAKYFGWESEMADHLAAAIEADLKSAEATNSQDEAVEHVREI